MSFAERLERARTLALRGWRPLGDPYPGCCLFLSVSDGKARALVVHAADKDFDAAWANAEAQLHTRMAARRLRGEWLRVDWVTHAEAASGQEFTDRLRQTKRNYFRYGLAFDDEFNIALTEQELNANAILYGGSGTPYAVMNTGNLAVYTRARFGGPLAYQPNAAVHILSTEGVFLDDTGDYALAGPGLDAGRRSLPQLDTHALRAIIREGSRYLAGQVEASGRFVYGYFPCFDRCIDTYNSLRHASSTYALIEAWAVTRDPFLKEAIDRSLSYLQTTLIRSIPATDHGPASVLIDTDNEVKLGGNAVAILALTKYCEISGERDFLPLAEELARGIGVMQDEATGRFIHVLNYPELTVKAENRIIYYEGEATFALMRLYDLTGEEHWIRMVENAFRHFIEAEHWRAHDHWLSYCVNELTRYRPKEEYFRFAIKNFDGYLNFVGSRITTFPTLLELMMAAHELLMRLDSNNALRHLLAEVDTEAFYMALERRAHRLLDGYFWPEFAMYMRNPSRILHSFFIRHHAFRVRIDDVEHYLSGLVAYLGYVAAGRPRVQAEAYSTRILSRPPNGAVSLWNSETVIAATGGRWLTPPPDGWTATGLCIWAPAMQPGAMVVARTSDEETGVPLSRLAQLNASAVITVNPELRWKDAPVLLVQALTPTILKLGHYARGQMHGKVLAVTGSAGKTTTSAMLAHVMREFGSVGETRHNANLPRGIAWNVASLDPSTSYIILELAIGQMRDNAKLARPDVAIFTNIAPAHLVYHKTLREVAERKSAIFSGMTPGGTAIINRDMAEYDVVVARARDRNLLIITYGEHKEADFRLAMFEHATNTSTVIYEEGTLCFTLTTPGKHFAMNGLAILAAAHALKLPVSEAARRLSSFTALPGRGEYFTIHIDGRPVTVVDDAYNANPASMKASLAVACEHDQSARKVLILGDMLELGQDEIRYHRELAPAVLMAMAHRVILCGPLMKSLEDELRLRSSENGVVWYKDADALKAELLSEVSHADYVLIKSSAGTGLSAAVALLRTQMV